MGLLEALEKCEGLSFSKEDDKAAINEFLPKWIKQGWHTQVSTEGTTLQSLSLQLLPFTSQEVQRGNKGPATSLKFYWGLKDNIDLWRADHDIMEKQGVKD